MAMKTPGVYIVEKNAFPNSVVQVATAVPAFIGFTEKAINGTVSLHMSPKRITSLSEFHQFYGVGPDHSFKLVDFVPGIGDKPPLKPKGKADKPLLPRAIFNTPAGKKELVQAGNKCFALYAAMRMFFQNGGGACYIVSIGSYEDEIADTNMTKALELLKKEAEPTMIVIPETTRLSRGKAAAVQQAVLKHCGLEMRNRFGILDIFAGHLPQGGPDGNPVAEFRNDIGTNQLNFGAAYYPWLMASLYDAGDFTFENIEPDSRNAFIDLLKKSITAPALESEIKLIGAPEVSGAMKITVARGGSTKVDADTFSAVDATPSEDAAKVPEFRVLPAPGSSGPGKFQKGGADATTFTQADLESGDMTFVHDATSSETELVIEVVDADGNSTGPMVVEVQVVGGVLAPDNTGKLKPVSIDVTAGVDGADKKSVELDGAAADKPKELTEDGVGEWKADDKGVITFTPADDFDGTGAKVKYTLTANEAKQGGEATVVLTGGEVEKRQGSPSVELIDKTLRMNVPLYKDVMATLAAWANTMPPAAAMAGLYTMVDNSRGVWKAPANVSVNGVDAPLVNINHEEQENLNVSTTGKSINAIRPFVGEGTLVWGARTLDGNSLDWRYISVRRTMIMLEESIRLAAKAYVFEPNTANTWVTMKSMIENFLTGIWKQGGLAGTSAADAFSVHVGLGDTMTPEDILEGILRITVLVAVTRPAEFIEITFQQQMQKS